MSELVDNRSHRIRTLKEIVQHLHAGNPPELERVKRRPDHYHRQWHKPGDSGRRFRPLAKWFNHSREAACFRPRGGCTGFGHRHHAHHCTKPAARRWKSSKDSRRLAPLESPAVSVVPWIYARVAANQAAGNKPKQIEKFAGGVNSGHDTVSVARMISPEGWCEPGQRPEFEEIVVVLIPISVSQVSAISGGQFWQTAGTQQSGTILKRTRSDMSVSAPQEVHLVSPVHFSSLASEQEQSAYQAANVGWRDCLFVDKDHAAMGTFFFCPKL